MHLSLSELSDHRYEHAFQDILNRFLSYGNNNESTYHYTFEPKWKTFGVSTFFGSSKLFKFHITEILNFSIEYILETKKLHGLLL